MSKFMKYLDPDHAMLSSPEALSHEIARVMGWTNEELEYAWTRGEAPWGPQDKLTNPTFAETADGALDVLGWARDNGWKTSITTTEEGWKAEVVKEDQTGPVSLTFGHMGELPKVLSALIIQAEAARNVD